MPSPITCIRAAHLKHACMQMKVNKSKQAIKCSNQSKNSGIKKSPGLLVAS